MQKWEYYWNDYERGWLTEEFHTMGENGWELVSVTQNGDRYTVFFKRPKDNNSE